METREILADAVKQSTADATRQIQGNLDRLAEGAPEGFAPFQAIRKGLDTHNAAFESSIKVADQLGGIAEANLQAIKEAAVPAPRRAARQRSARPDAPRKHRVRAYGRILRGRPFFACAALRATIAPHDPRR